jgi:Protein of unknown function (DUF3667)
MTPPTDVDAADTPVTAPPRLSMRAFWHDVGDEVFSLDRGLLWTAWRMTRRPGSLIRHYVVDRESRTTRPLRFFLIGFALMALAFQYAGAADATIDGVREGMQRGGGRGSAITDAVIVVLRHIQWLLLCIALPVLAGALRLVFRRFDPNFAEMWVFGLYLMGEVWLVWAVLVTLSSFAGLPGLLYLLLVVPPLTLIAACLGYFDGGRLAIAWRALLVTAVVGIAVVLSLGIAIAIASSLVVRFT